MFWGLAMQKELMERKGAYYQMMSQQAGLDASSGRVVISPGEWSARSRRLEASLEVVL